MVFIILKNLNMDFLFVLYAKKNQDMINGKEKAINGYFIRIMFGMPLIAVMLMIFLKIAGKKLEEVLLNNGIKQVGFVPFANKLLKCFWIMFLIIKDQKKKD